MDYQKLAKKLQGLQTISTISKILGIKKRTAINYVYELRKKDYVGTTYGKRGIRMYKISPVKRKIVGYPSLYEVINKNSKVGLVTSYEYRVHNSKLSIEETIVKAVETKSFRVILASLGLFSKVKNWSKLYRFAKKNNLGRKIGALYDVARTVIKVRKMDLRIRNRFLKNKVKEKYVIPNLKSKDFKNIEKLWRVYIPFRKADLWVYKE